MASKKKGQPESSKFEGNGISFKAKLIGVEEVGEARGDLLCQEAITKLKNAVKASGQHKQKILINVTLEGLKIIDAISLVVLHTHPVHRISFISRDTTDNRAFGYIVGSGDGKHTFFAIKTAAAAEQLVLTLRDLFQVVYEMKTKEVKEAKEKLEVNNEETETENGQPSGEGSTSEVGQTQTTEVQAAEGDGIYQVPPNNAPVKASLEEQQANLLDLEDQADTILKGIEQIKNLDFDSMTNDGDMSPKSPMSPAPPTGTADPWAVPSSTPTPTAAPAAGAGNSNLGDLAGIQTGPFVNMQNMQQQAFTGGAFPINYNTPGVPAYNMANAGLPVTRDPFGHDPFGANYRHPVPQAGFPAPGFPAPGFPAANPFGGAGFGQPFPGAGRPPVPGMVPPTGMFPASPTAAAAQNPFANNNIPEDPNMLKPIRKDQKGQEETQDQDKGGKAPKEDLFGDLLGIRKSTADAKTPKDMFAQLTAADKKSMNQLKSMTEMPPQSTNASPFGDAFISPAPANVNNNNA